MKNKNINISSSSLLKVLGLLSAVIVLMLGLMMYKKITKPKLPLIQSLNSILPKEAQGNVLTNQDQMNPGKQIISLVHPITEGFNVKKQISEFIYQGFERIHEPEMSNVSVLTIVLYKKPTKEGEKTIQYRVVLGADVARQKSKDFWSDQDQKDLFQWLTKTCPSLKPTDLSKFCDISDNLKE